MIPEHVQRFVRNSIKSVWTLDLLLMMRRDSGRSWTVESLTQESRTNRTLVGDILSDLGRSGLIEAVAPDSYRYGPANPELAGLVEELARIYAERPITVVKEIVSAPNEKIQTFADAFKIKKD